MWGLGTRTCEIDGRRWPSLAPLVIRVTALDYRDPPLRAKKVLLARRNRRTSHLYMGGLGRPQIRIPRLLRQLKAGIAHTMPSLRALRGKNQPGCSCAGEWMLRSCYPAPTGPLTFTWVAWAGHRSESPGCCGNSKQALHTLCPASEPYAAKITGCAVHVPLRVTWAHGRMAAWGLGRVHGGVIPVKNDPEYCMHLISYQHLVQVCQFHPFPSYIHTRSHQNMRNYGGNQKNRL